MVTKTAWFGKKTVAKAVESVSEATKKGITEGADEVIKKNTPLATKILLYGAGIGAVGGTGYVGGRIHGSNNFKKALNDYNEAENKAIANEYYNQGLLSKQAGIKELLAIVGGTGLIGGAGYIGGRMHQAVRNKELANQFNALNQQENAEIAQQAFEMGKSAGLRHEIAASFKAIPEFFHNRIMQYHMHLGAERMARGLLSPEDIKVRDLLVKINKKYDKPAGEGSWFKSGTPEIKGGEFNPTARQLKYERLKKMYSAKAKEALSKTNLATAILSGTAGLGGGVGVGMMIGGHKKEASWGGKILNYLSRGGEAPVMHAVEKDVFRPSATEVAVKSPSKGYKIKIDRGPSETQVQQIHKARSAEPVPINAVRSEQAVVKQTPKKTSLPKQAPTKAPKPKQAPTKAPEPTQTQEPSRFNKYIHSTSFKNVGKGALGIGIGGAGLGFGYHQMMTPKAQQ